MQLFITDFIQDGEHIIITEERVVSQLSKVLRAKKGDQIAVQNSQIIDLPAGRQGHNSELPKTKRLICAISEITKDHIAADILTSEEREVALEQKYLAVAMPNKFEKLELIVQKCTEMGVQHIIFFPAKYSLLKEISPSKMERLEKISLEASEQSWSRKKIDMTFIKNVLPMCEGKKVFVAHQNASLVQNSQLKTQNDGGKILLVGPEGGRHSDEEKIFNELHVEKISFGENILRTETASIIGGRLIKSFL